MRKLFTVAVFLALFCSLASGAISFSRQAGSPGAEGLHFTYQIGGPVPGPATGQVTSVSGRAEFSVSVSQSWLQVSPVSGYTPASIEVSVDPSGLKPGTYNASLTVRTSYTAQGGGTVTGSDTSSVTLTVVAPPPVTVTCPASPIAVSGTAGRPVPSQSVNILASGSTALNYTVSSSQAWLGASAGTTNTPGTVTINHAALAAGTHSGQLSYSIPGGTPDACSVTVNLTLAAAVDTFTSAPPAQLTFNITQGGAAPSPQSFSVVAANQANAAFSLTSPAPPSWLSITPAAGTTPEQFTVSVNPAGLTAAGSPYTYTATYSYPTTAAKTYSTAITVTVAPPPAAVISFSPQSLSFSAAVTATSNPDPTVVTISATAAGAPASLPVSVVSAPDWVQVSLLSATTPATAQVTASLVGKPVGPLTGTVTLHVGTANVDIPVSAIISPVSIQASPGSLTVNGVAGQAPAAPQAYVNLTTSTTGAVSFSVASSAPWLSATADSNSVSASASAGVSITADASRLSAGQQTATVDVFAGAQKVGAISVTFVIAAPPVPLKVAGDSLTFAATARGALTDTKTVALTTDPALLAFTVAADAWIKVTPGSGTGSQALSVQVDPKTLDPGRYSGAITISAGAATKTISVEVDVVAPNAPSFSAGSSISFTQPQYMPGTPHQTVALSGLDQSVTANTLLRWSVALNTETGGQWLSVSQIDTSTFPYTFEVYANPAGLTPGNYTGTVTVTARSGDTKSASIPVALTITEPVRNSYDFSISDASATREFGVPGADSFVVDLIPAAPGLTYTATATGGGWLKIDSSGTGTMPSTVRFSIDSANMPVGVHKGKLVVTASAPAGVLVNKVRELEATLTVTAPKPAKLEARVIGSGMFVVDRNNPAASVTSQALVAVRNTGSGTIPLTVVSESPWLEFDSSSVTVGSAETLLSARVRLDQLAASSGVHGGSYRLTYAGGSDVTGVATLNISAAVPQIDVRPVAGTLTGFSGYRQPLTASATIVNTGSAPVTYSVSKDASWLSASDSSGTLQAGASKTVTLSVATGLTAGTHYGSVTFSASAGDSAVEKTYSLAVMIQPSGQPQVSPGNAVLTVQTGAFTQQYTISNPSATELDYLVTSAPISSVYSVRTCPSCPFTEVTLDMPAAASSISNASGKIPAGGSVAVTVNGTMANQALGSTVLFNVGYNSFSRNLTVYPAGTSAGKELAAGTCDASRLYAQFTNLNADSTVTAGLPTALNVVLVDGCGSPVSKARVSAEFSNGDSPVVLQPSGTPGAWTGTWVPFGASAPQVRVSLIAENTAQTFGSMTRLTVNVTKSAGIPIVQPNGVVNTGDYGTPMATAAGSYVSIFGTGLAPSNAGLTSSDIPTTLAGTTVTLGGRALPLVFASPVQVNAFIPYDVAPGSILPLQVVRASGRSVSWPIVVADCKPAMFLRDGSAARPGLVVAYRGSQSFLVDANHPVAAGDYLVLYGIGLGPVDQNLAPYKITPTSPLARLKETARVMIGGKDGTVAFAGLSPGSLGLYQVNVQVPAGVSPGNQVPVVITVDGNSTSVVTIPVR